MQNNEFDVIVVGAGHAGCEAALATSRLGFRTLLITMNLESVAMMPCNPSIGGTGKGHLVREIDALGGEMGINADKALIQSKMLNTAKGPAVHSLRAQEDKSKYHIEMKKVIEKQENLELKQAEVVKLLLDYDGDKRKVIGVLTSTNIKYFSKRTILATGTFLNSKIFIGNEVISSGPNGLRTSNDFSKYLIDELGLDMRRFKTGTPARVNKRSINFDVMEVQKGDDVITPFSFMNDKIDIEQVDCYLTYTNLDTHNVINENIEKSAMYSGNIQGVGARYCPSIEDKIKRFEERERHQIFIEPEGLDTNEMYIQGISTSLPEDIQYEFMKTIKGLENLEIMRPAYAIEYDCINPMQLKLSLESKDIDCLFSAGQFNGTSGYEEAAAQGLIAGINAALSLKGEKPLILDRSQAYIGVLIDDLVTKGTLEPYRIMTGRCEYRLILRQDNADQRLTEIGYSIGLVTEERYKKYLDKMEKIKNELERIKSTKVHFEKINRLFDELNYGYEHTKFNMSLYDLLKRPELTYDNLKVLDENRPNLDKVVIDDIEIQIKYDGYIDKQLQQIKKFKSMEQKILPEDINYSEITGLRIEAMQKLQKYRPYSLGQAARISGVSPADISVLIIYLEQKYRLKNNK